MRFFNEQGKVIAMSLEKKMANAYTHQSIHYTVIMDEIVAPRFTIFNVNIKSAGDTFIDVKGDTSMHGILIPIKGVLFWGEALQIPPYHYNILGSPDFNFKILLEIGTYSSFLFVSYRESMLVEWISKDEQSPYRPLLRSIYNCEPFCLFDFPMPASLPMLIELNDLLNPALYTGYKMYVEVHVMEMLFYAMKPFHDNSRHLKKTWSTYDLKNVYVLMEKIFDTMGVCGTLTMLAANENINVTQFQRDFKLRFSCTPYYLVTTLRMKLAMSMLRDTKTSLSSVAKKIGYSSARALKKAYRNHFGHTLIAIKEKSN